jgi:hypothetical protein
MKFKVTNWAKYDAGLRRRGSLTLGGGRVKQWPTDGGASTHRGRQCRYSDLAIETGSTFRWAFHLPLRQTEDFQRVAACLIAVGKLGAVVGEDLW